MTQSQYYSEIVSYGVEKAYLYNSKGKKKKMFIRDQQIIC